VKTGDGNEIRFTVKIQANAQNHSVSAETLAKSWRVVKIHNKHPILWGTMIPCYGPVVRWSDFSRHRLAIEWS
jgi:hypothetical protein